MNRLGALSEPDFRNLYFARAFSLIGDGMVPVALAFGVLETDNSASALGAVLAARSLTLVIFLLIGGVIADRVPRRRLMISSDTLRFIAQAATAAILISRTAKVWEIAALAVIYGFGNAFFLPTSTGIIPQTVSPARLQQANALISLTQNSCTIAGPVLASLIIVTIGAGWAFAIDAATFLISIFFVARLPTISAAPQSGYRFLDDLREGWQAFRSRRWLLIDGVASALASCAVLAPFLTLGPVVAQDHLHGASSWAAIIAAFGAGSVIGGLGLLRFVPSRPLLVAVLPPMLLALPTGLLAIPAPTAAIAVGAFAAGCGLAVFNTLFETTVQQNIPPSLLSRVAAIDWMLGASLMPLGQALAGPLSSLVGFRAIFLFAAAWIIASTAIVLAFPDIRNFRNAPPVPASTEQSAPQDAPQGVTADPDPS